MMMSNDAASPGDIRCLTCFENFVRGVNEPVSCVPCGHVVCAPCLEAWRRSLGYRRALTCPMCRAPVQTSMQNRELMNAVEAMAGGDHGGTSSGDAVMGQSYAPAPSAPPIDLAADVAPADSGGTPPQLSQEARGRPSQDADPFALTRERLLRLAQQTVRKPNADQELLQDKSRLSCVILDNSGSMGTSDGKLFLWDVRNDRFTKHSPVSRWQEAVSKVMQIAVYNLRRRMVAQYFLLNPRVPDVWVPGEDVVEIDCSGVDLAKLSNTTKTAILAECHAEQRGGKQLPKGLARFQKSVESSSTFEDAKLLLERLLFFTTTPPRWAKFIVGHTGLG